VAAKPASSGELFTDEGECGRDSRSTWTRERRTVATKERLTASHRKAHLAAERVTPARGHAPASANSGMPPSATQLSSEGHGRSTGLVEVLDRILDKGLVVAGDIKVSLAEVELLTIRIRLLICSIDKAEQIGLDWWKYDHHLSPGKQALSAENDELKKQVRALERRLASLTRHRSAPGLR